MKKRWIAFLLALVLGTMPAIPASAAETQTTGTEEPATTEAAAEPAGKWDGKYYLLNGKKVKGLQEIDGKLYFFDKKAKLVTSKVAYKIGKKYYNINKKGVCTLQTGIYDLACKRLVKQKAVPTSLTAKKLEASLKKAFLWAAKTKYVRRTEKKLEPAAKYTFKTGAGDCTNQAAAFVAMATVLGYKAELVRGYVPTAVDKKGNPTKFNAHAWATIKIGKKTYAFDPNFNGSSDAKKLRKKNKYVGFKFKYGAKNTYRYYDAKKKPLQ